MRNLARLIFLVLDHIKSRHLWMKYTSVMKTVNECIHNPKWLWDNLVPWKICYFIAVKERALRREVTWCSVLELYRVYTLHIKSWHLLSHQQTTDSNMRKLRYLTIRPKRHTHVMVHASAEHVAKEFRHVEKWAWTNNCKSNHSWSQFSRMESPSSLDCTHLPLGLNCGLVGVSVCRCPLL